MPKINSFATRCHTQTACLVPIFITSFKAQQDGKFSHLSHTSHNYSKETRLYQLHIPDLCNLCATLPNDATNQFIRNCHFMCLLVCSRLVTILVVCSQLTTSKGSKSCANRQYCSKKYHIC